MIHEALFSHKSLSTWHLSFPTWTQAKSVGELSCPKTKLPIIWIPFKMIAFLWTDWENPLNSNRYVKHWKWLMILYMTYVLWIMKHLFNLCYWLVLGRCRHILWHLYPLHFIWKYLIAAQLLKKKSQSHKLLGRALPFSASGGPKFDLRNFSFLY